MGCVLASCPAPAGAARIVVTMLQSQAHSGLDDKAKRAYVDADVRSPVGAPLAANGGNFEPNPTTSAKLGSPSPHEDENAMADARSETTIDDERVRVTTWSFEKAGDSTGAHVHEYDYVLVPVTGGTLTAVSTTDGSARTITQVAGSPYTGQAGLAHTVTADADGIVFVEVELKN